MHRYTSQFSNADRHKTFLPSHFRHTLKGQTKQRARCKGKKKKSAIFFESQAASHNRAAVSLNSGTGSAESSQTGALCSQGNRFVVVPLQCMGVHVNGSSRHINTASLPAVHQTRLTGAKRKTSDQGSVRQYQCGGEKAPRRVQAYVLAHCSVVCHASNGYSCDP